MKKSLLFLFILCSSYVHSQNKIVVLEMIKNARDSIAENRFESASRILDGASVYNIYADSIAYWRNEMIKKGIDLSYEKYKERLFDMSMKYFQDVMGNDTSEVVNYYWMTIAPKMCFTKRVGAAVDLSEKAQIIGHFVQQLKRRISKEKYLMILKATLTLEEKKGNDVNASFLLPSQDETTKKWGFKDSKGVLLIPYEYDEIISEFKYGIAIVKQNGIYGYLHVTGLSTFNMSEASSWNTVGNEALITPNINVGGKTVKEFLEEIQNLVTY